MWRLDRQCSRNVQIRPHDIKLKGRAHALTEKYMQVKPVLRGLSERVNLRQRTLLFTRIRLVSHSFGEIVFTVSQTNLMDNLNNPVNVISCGFMRTYYLVHFIFKRENSHRLQITLAFISLKTPSTLYSWLKTCYTSFLYLALYHLEGT